MTCTFPSLPPRAQHFGQYNFVLIPFTICFAFKRGYLDGLKRLIIAISNNLGHYYLGWSKLLFINSSFNAGPRSFSLPLFCNIHLLRTNVILDAAIRMFQYLTYWRSVKILLLEFNQSILRPYHSVMLNWRKQNSVKFYFEDALDICWC